MHHSNIVFLNNIEWPFKNTLKSRNSQYNPTFIVTDHTTKREPYINKYIYMHIPTPIYTWALWREWEGEGRRKTGGKNE